MHANYLESVSKQFKYYKDLGDKTLNILTFDEMQWQPGADANSVAIVVKHMAGNMLSRWTNFKTEDGEKHGANEIQNLKIAIPAKKKL